MENTENAKVVREEFRGKMYNVHSSNLAKIGFFYDRTLMAGVVRVEFKKGNVYEYWPVEKKLYSEAFGNPSIGSWFQTNFTKNKELNYEKMQ